MFTTTTNDLRHNKAFDNINQPMWANLPFSENEEK